MFVVGRFSMNNLFLDRPSRKVKPVSFVVPTLIHNLPKVKLIFIHVEALSVFAILFGVLASRLVGMLAFFICYLFLYRNYHLFVAKGKKEDLLILDLRAM